MPTTPPSGSIPQDMRDLLVRLDTKVDAITATLALMNQRADGHDDRIKEIELELADRATLKNRFFDLEKTVTTHSTEIADIDRAFKFGRGLVIASWTVFAVLGGLAINWFG